MWRRSGSPHRRGGPLVAVAKDEAGRGRVTVIDWKPEEAKARAERLRAAGFTANHASDLSPAALRKLFDRPPDAVVIDLGRMPSNGRDLAIWLRQRGATRHTPIVFAGGRSEKVATVKVDLPDAEYTGWRGIEAALDRAIAHPPSYPVVPRPMEGYSKKPLATKLGIEPGMLVMLLGAPKDAEEILGDVPDGVTFKRQAKGTADLVILFVKSHAGLEYRFSAAVRSLGDGAGLWIAWPKKASGVATDLTQNVVRAHGLASGLVDYKIAAIGETWSGLRFTRRRR